MWVGVESLARAKLLRGTVTSAILVYICTKTGSGGVIASVSRGRASINPDGVLVHIEIVHKNVNKVWREYGLYLYAYSVDVLLVNVYAPCLTQIV